MPARQRIPLTILDATGIPRVGASAHVKQRPTGNTITVYSTETGAGTLANPGAVITGADGRFPGYVARNSLLATVSGGGLPAPVDIEFEANPGSRAALYYAQAAGTGYNYSGNNTWNLLPMSVESFDPDNVFTPSATSGAAYYTIPEAGFYRFETTVAMSSLNANISRDLGFWVTTTSGTGGAQENQYAMPTSSNESTIQAPVITISLTRKFDPGMRIMPTVRLATGSGTSLLSVNRFVGYMIGV